MAKYKEKEVTVKKIVYTNIFKVLNKLWENGKISVHPKKLAGNITQLCLEYLEKEFEIKRKGEE